jgi:hypothetical protein
MIDSEHDRRHVAWDLETTGFAWDAVITVSGFWFPGAHAELVVNTDGIDADHHETHLERVTDATVTITPTDDETALLEAIRRIVFDRFDREYNRLTAFHGESWQGGFDLPFLRTRCTARGVDWVFDGLTYADVWDPVKKRVNTTAAYWGKTDAEDCEGLYRPYGQIEEPVEVFDTVGEDEVSEDGDTY